MMLENGSPLPAIEAKDLEASPIVLSDLTAGSWSVVIFYRGDW